MHTHAPPTAKMRRVLQFSLAATLAYVAITLIAGLRANSLALISEAGHNASDALALLLSFVAVHFQALPATERKTFGYRRAGVLAAFLNAIGLIVISAWIAIAAVGHFARPVHSSPDTMMVVAAIGMVMNGIIAAMLWRVSHDLNMRSAFLHMLGDALSTAAVIVGGAVIYFTGSRWVDPALSLAIAALILWSSIAIVRETLNILLEGTPRGLSLSEIRAKMQEVEGVEDVHDLHVWSLGAQTHALSSHVTIADIPPSESARILDEINGVLLRSFHIHHTTIQFEHVGCPVAHGCVMPVEEVAAHQHHH
ncbi:MAG TPA: cation diffusion facilitator family transporter [Acidobacteriaceae bacterium]|nr:cation diffusion facilitator family transporter [Acidobacteriaceae bacterium]